MSSVTFLAPLFARFQFKGLKLGESSDKMQDREAQTASPKNIWFLSRHLSNFYEFRKPCVEI